MPSKRHASQQYERMFADAEQVIEGFLRPAAPIGELTQIPVTALVPSPYQPRESFSSAAISELAASIKEQGLLQPILVRSKEEGRYEIVAGERRWRAAQEAGLENIPCIIQEFSDSDAQIVALIENLHRKDLNDLERGKALQNLKNALLVPWPEIAQRVGLTKRSVLRLAGLVDLPEHIQGMFGSGQLTEKHGRALRQLKDDPEQQTQIAEAIKKYDLSGDETIRLVRQRTEHHEQSVDETVQELRATQRAPAGAIAIIKGALKLIQLINHSNVKEMNTLTRKAVDDTLQALEAVSGHCREKLGRKS